MTATATAPATKWLLDLLDAVGSQPTGKTNRQCPAHTDASPSLSIGQNKNGAALIRCHAGCTWKQILAALSCKTAYLYDPPPVTAVSYAAAFCTHLTFPPLIHTSGHPSARGLQFEREHPYGDRWWLLRYRHPTTGTKELMWESLNPRGERVPGLLGTPTAQLPLYRERDIHMAIAAEEPVLLVESESSVDSLNHAGWYATTWAGGAASPKIDTLRRVLSQYDKTLVIPDHDQAGLGCLLTLHSHGLAPNILLPEPGEDARDLLNRVGQDEFRHLVDRHLLP